MGDADKLKLDADAAEGKRPDSLWLVTDSGVEKTPTGWSAGILTRGTDGSVAGQAYELVSRACNVPGLQRTGPATY